MRVIHLINALEFGGAESLLSDFVKVQQDSGIDVSVLCLRKATKGFEEKITQYGIRVTSLSENGSVYNPINILRIISHLKRCDIMHVHLFPSQWWAVFAKIISFNKTRIVTTEHNTNNRRRKKMFLRLFDTFIYNTVKMVVCCSDKALECFKITFPKANSTVINNGIDLKRYHEAVPYKKEKVVGDSNAFIVTMVARFKYPKRQDLLIEALKLLPEGIHVVLIGNGDENGQLGDCRELARKLEVSNRVHFLGVRTDVPSLLKTSDINVLASEYEGLSLSSVEGMSVGKPFLSTDVAGLKEIVGGAGLLFKVNNPEQLAAIIIDLYEHPNTCRYIAERCFKRAMQYDIHKMSEQYTQLYKVVLSM